MGYVHIYLIDLWQPSLRWKLLMMKNCSITWFIYAGRNYGLRIWVNVAKFVFYMRLVVSSNQCLIRFLCVKLTWRNQSIWKDFHERHHTSWTGILFSEWKYLPNSNWCGFFHGGKIFVQSCMSLVFSVRFYTKSVYFS